MTASILIRVVPDLRQRSKRVGSRSGPSSASLVRCPAGIPAGTACSVASTPALGGTLSVAGGDAIVVTLGATDERESPPDKPRTGRASVAGSRSAARPLGADVAGGATSAGELAVGPGGGAWAGCGGGTIGSAVADVAGGDVGIEARAG